MSFHPDPRGLPLDLLGRVQEVSFLKLHRAALAAAKAKGNKSFRGDQCNVNGVSAESAVPYNRDTTLPPIMHLILGLVNAIKGLMHAMLKNLSSLSPELAARLSARADELFAAEEAIASAVCGVVDLIGDAEAEAIVSAMQAAEAAGGGDATGAPVARTHVAPVGEDGRRVASGEIGGACSDWEELAAAADAETESIRAEAQADVDNWRAQQSAYTRQREEEGHRQPAARGRTRSPAPGRWDDKIKRREAEAALLDAAKELRESIAKYQELLAHGVDEQGEEAESSLASAVQIALRKIGVNIQKHWAGTLQGADCRRMLERRAELLSLLHAAIMDAERGVVEADAFVQRHREVLDALHEVFIHTRRVTGDGPHRLLSDAQLGTLISSCSSFAEAWRRNYGRMLPPKGHCVEHEVPYYASLYGILGPTGEDGCEHHHVMEKECASKVRTMQNPEARFKAKHTHLLAAKHTPDTDMASHARTLKKQRVVEAAAAEAGVADAAAPLPAAEVAEVAVAAPDAAP